MLSGYMHDENKLIKKKYKAGSSYDRDFCADLCVYSIFAGQEKTLDLYFSPQLPLTLGIVCRLLSEGYGMDSLQDSLGHYIGVISAISSNIV